MAETIHFPSTQADALAEIAAARAAFQLPVPARLGYLDAADPLRALLHQWGATDISPTPVAQAPSAAAPVSVGQPPPTVSQPTDHYAITALAGLAPVLLLLVWILQRKQSREQLTFTHLFRQRRKSGPKLGKTWVSKIITRSRHVTSGY